MPYYYEVFHRRNPEGRVILAFKEKQSLMRVRDKACTYGHFQWKYYKEIVVRTAKQAVPLEAFIEVEAT